MWHGRVLFALTLLVACGSGERLQAKATVAALAPGKGAPESNTVKGRSAKGSHLAKGGHPPTSPNSASDEALEQYGIKEVRQLSKSGWLRKVELTDKAKQALLKRLKLARDGERQDQQDQIDMEPLLEDGKIQGPKVAVLDTQDVGNEGQKQSQTYVDLFHQESFMAWYKNGQGNHFRLHKPFNQCKVEIYFLLPEPMNEEQARFNPPDGQTKFETVNLLIKKCDFLNFDEWLADFTDEELQAQAGHETFLHTAVLSFCAPIVEMLTEPTARTSFMMESVDEHGATPLETAPSFRNLARMFRPGMEASARSFGPILEALVKAMQPDALLHQAPPSPQLPGGGTVLHIAAHTALATVAFWKPILRQLHSSHPDVLARMLDMRNGAGNTPLLQMVHSSNAGARVEELVKYLTTEQLLAKDPTGKTALHIVVSMQNLSATQELLRLLPGDLRLTRDNDGKTALDLAEEVDDAEILQSFEMFP